MTTFSKADLATRILKDLGVTDARETPNADDQAWAEETVSAEIALLAAKNIQIANGSEDAVPQEYLTVLARRIALAVAPSFGITDLATAQMAMREAEKDLIYLARTPATGAQVKISAF